MSTKIKFDPKRAQAFVTEEELNSMENEVLSANKVLIEGTGEGNDYIGWVDLPINYDKEEFKRIKETAAKIRRESKVLIVIGIGGSYLGAKAAVEALSPNFYNEKAVADGGCEVYFAGNNISPRYLKNLINLVGDRDFSVNVISKSGTTTEPAIAFRIFKGMLEKKYGEKAAAGRIYATTDREKGALKTLADANGYETFVVPDNVGGRYSVLTAVGLLPIAVAGIDIDALMQGAADERMGILAAPFAENSALQYAAYRNILYRKGKTVEILANYEPALHYVSEWWKQLYGESEGKDKKGIFPAAVDLTTDLHSMGQYIQDGTRMLMETVLCVDDTEEKIVIEKDKDNLDGLNYLAGKDLDFINKQAMYGTMLAHNDGGVPNMMVHMPKMDAASLGALFYFFEYACGVSGYTLGVNPFNQQGVESYKKNMFALLGKPGYEEAGASLRKRLGE